MAFNTVRNNVFGHIRPLDLHFYAPLTVSLKLFK